MLLFCIVALTFVTFAIKPDGVPFHRFALNLTLLFTAMALKFVVARSLPMVGYLTLLDKFVLANFCFLFMVIIYNGILIGLVAKENLVAVDEVGFICIVGLWIFIQVGFYIHFRHRTTKSKHQFEDRMRRLHGAKVVGVNTGEDAVLPIGNLGLRISTDGVGSEEAKHKEAK